MIPLSIQDFALTTKKLKDQYDAISSVPTSETTPIPTLESLMSYPVVSKTVNPDTSKTILSLLKIFALIFIFSIILWFVALFLLFKYWKIIPAWAGLLGTIFLFRPEVPLGPIWTILLVLVLK